MKGFILTSNAWHPYIQTMVTDVPGGSVDFTSAPNGAGTVIISGSVSATLNTYGTTYGYVGTPPSNWNVQIRVYDPDVNDYYYSLGLPAIVSGDSGKVLTNNGTSASWIDGVRVYTDSVVFPTRSSTPVTSWTAGQVYYDTSMSKLRCYNGSTWVDLF